MKKIIFSEKNRLLNEIFLMLLFSAVMLHLSAKYDLYEHLEELFGRHESVQFDEIVITFITTGLLGWLFMLARLTDLYQEIQHRIITERRLEWIVMHDELTKAGNRRGLEEITRVMIKDREDKLVNVYSIDLDGFKKLNDLLGHAAGDEALVEVVARLKRMFINCPIYRMGGDEFLIIQNYSEEKTPMMNANLIVDVISESYYLQGSFFRLGVSVGLVTGPQQTIINLIRNADIAMYHAKRDKDCKIFIFEESMLSSVISKNKLEQDLRSALKKRDIKPFFQPLMDLENNTVRGFEILSRWKNEDGDYVNPIDFITIAEEAGLITELSFQVLDMACAVAVYWPENIALSLNISGKYSPEQY